jgi:hypothetical protein
MACIRIGVDEVRIRYEMQDAGKLAERVFGRELLRQTELFAQVREGTVALRIVEPESQEEEKQELLTLLTPEDAQALFDFLKGEGIVS